MVVVLWCCCCVVVLLLLCCGLLTRCHGRVAALDSFKITLEHVVSSMVAFEEVRVETARNYSLARDLINDTALASQFSAGVQMLVDNINGLSIKNVSRDVLY